MKCIPIDDLKHVCHHTRKLWSDCFTQGSTIFVTGGTGFFGKWLMETFLFINQELGLNGKLLVLSRNPEKFLQEFPQFNVSSIHFLKGDVRSFKFPKESIDFIVHAATDTAGQVTSEEHLLYETIVEGGKRILDLAKEKNVKSLLITSSGAVYGNQPINITHISEDFAQSIEEADIYSAYGRGKRDLEKLCQLYFENYNVPAKIARCFAFAGPYLSLDSHFAVASFFRSVLRGVNIEIEGGVQTYRSYMYASDLMIWLWTILLKAPSCRPYNVGSEEAITIEELAHEIVSLSNKQLTIGFKNPIDKSTVKRYLPSTARARRELELDVWINAHEALLKTYNYYKDESK